MRTGTLFIIAAPSGAGKTTLVRAVAEATDNLRVSISYTTRPRRPGELDGINYFFVNEQQFQTMVTKQAFLEHANVFGYHYGTSKQWVTQKLAAGIDIILEIDWQGVLQILSMQQPCVPIFILPPSYHALSERLQARAQDDKKIIANRLAGAHDEITYYKKFDYLIINDSFDKALLDIQAIIRAQRLLRINQEQIHMRLINELLQHP